VYWVVAWLHASAHDGELPDTVTDGGPKPFYAAAAETKKAARFPGGLSLDTKFQPDGIFSELTLGV